MLPGHTRSATTSIALSLPLVSTHTSRRGGLNTRQLKYSMVCLRDRRPSLCLGELGEGITENVIFEMVLRED